MLLLVLVKTLTKMCLDCAADNSVLLQEWKLKCRIFDICALVLLLKSTKFCFNTKYLGKDFKWYIFVAVNFFFFLIACCAFVLNFKCAKYKYVELSLQVQKWSKEQSIIKLLPSNRSSWSESTPFPTDIVTYYVAKYDFSLWSMFLNSKLCQWHFVP